MESLFVDVLRLSKTDVLLPTAQLDQVTCSEQLNCQPRRNIIKRITELCFEKAIQIVQRLNGDHIQRISVIKINQVEQLGLDRSDSQLVNQAVGSCVRPPVRS